MGFSRFWRKFCPSWEEICGAAGAPGRKTEAPQAPLEEIVGAEGAPERKIEAPQAPR